MKVNQSRWAAKRRFIRDRDQWHAETQLMSSVTDIAANPAYQRIIGLGPIAVEFMIEDLRQQPDHWFMALVAIVGEDIAAGAETISHAAERWIDWWDGPGSTGYWCTA